MLSYIARRALTMIPTLCFYFLRIKSGSTDESFTSPFYRRYRELLIAGLRHPYLCVGATVGYRHVTSIAKK